MYKTKCSSEDFKWSFSLSAIYILSDLVWKHSSLFIINFEKVMKSFLVRNI